MAWKCSHTFSKCWLYLQPLVLTHQCHTSFKEGEKMMWIVRNSAPAPLLRRHQCLFSQGKPCMKTWSMWRDCCASGMISAIALVSEAAVLWTEQLKMERDLWALLTAKQQTPESLASRVTTQWEQNAGGSPELFLLGFKVKLPPL